MPGTEIPVSPLVCLDVFKASLQNLLEMELESKSNLLNNLLNQKFQRKQSTDCKFSKVPLSQAQPKHAQPMVSPPLRTGREGLESYSISPSSLQRKKINKLYFQRRFKFIIEKIVQMQTVPQIPSSHHSVVPTIVLPWFGTFVRIDKLILIHYY